MTFSLRENAIASAFLGGYHHDYLLIVHGDFDKSCEQTVIL